MELLTFFSFQNTSNTFKTPRKSSRGGYLDLHTFISTLSMAKIKLLISRERVSNELYDCSLPNPPLMVHHAFSLTNNTNYDVNNNFEFSRGVCVWEGGGLVSETSSILI